MRPLLAMTVLATGLAAQDDLRDLVTLTDGREVRGRVITPFAGDEVTVEQGSTTLELPRARIAAMETVTDHLRELFAKRKIAGDNPKMRWILVEWARSRELPEMATLLATELVLDEPDHAGARAFLGHRRRKEEWFWRHEGRWLTRERLEGAIESWGRALELRSEHWRLRANGGIPQMVDALLDLERLYVWWFDHFGERLDLHEVREPMDVHCRRSVEEFPRWGMAPRPYFTPPPFGDVARTWYPSLAPDRPADLFFLGSQHLLYKALAGDPSVDSDRDRVCAWLEVGLGRYAAQSLHGPPGHVEPTGWRPRKVEMLAGAAWGDEVENLIHMPMYASFYMRNDTQNEANWGAAASFAAFFLEHSDPGVRERFDRYIVAAFRHRRGDSSSAFDEAMGVRIESFAAAWRQWAGQMGR